MSDVCGQPDRENDRKTKLEPEKDYVIKRTRESDRETDREGESE